MPRVVVNGEQLASDTAVLVDGSLMVPADGLADWLDARADHLTDSDFVKFTRNETILFLRLGVPAAVVEGTYTLLQATPYLNEDTPMVPLRFVAEALGAKVVWDEKEGIAYLTTVQLGDASLGAYLRPINVTASAEDWEFGAKEHACDGDLTTRWAAKGPAWLTYDLGAVKTISAVNIAWVQAEGRSYRFTLSYSEDGKNWSEPQALSSGRAGAGFESFPISGVRARYIRYTGSGSEDSDWNAILEWEVYGG